MSEKEAPVAVAARLGYSLNKNQKGNVKADGGGETNVVSVVRTRLNAGCVLSLFYGQPGLQLNLGSLESSKASELHSVLFTIFLA